MKAFVLYTQEISQLKIDDFVKLDVIEKGYYGKVYLVNFKKEGRVYALKAIRKDRLSQIHDFSIFGEFKVLEGLDNPFITKSYFSFQNENKIFLGSEYCPGGDFAFFLNHHRKRLKDEQIQFYFAQVVMAIDYLHYKNILYKDLRSQFIFLDAEGYLKLNNFCLCNDVLDINSFTQHGSEYLPPEVIIGETYGRAVDIWCLGVLLYEMYYGIVSSYIILATIL
jgi:serine/threonine protein kinase